MALKAGRVGVAPEQVDEFGQIKSEATEGYTKQEADAKFETQTNASTEYAKLQPKTLQVPIEMLTGSALTVESGLGKVDSDIFSVMGTPHAGKAVINDTSVSVTVTRKTLPEMVLANMTYLVIAYDFSYTLPNNFIIAFMAKQNDSYTIKKIIESEGAGDVLSLSISRSADLQTDTITLTSGSNKYMNLLVWKLPVNASGFNLVD